MFEQKTKSTEKFINMSVNTDLGDVVEYTNNLFQEAIETGSSDIHIEPVRESVSVRFRESGDFIFIDRIALDEYAKLLSRIKILANLRIDEKQRPQDGKIAFQGRRGADDLIDIRVSVMPVVDGEKVVMRILRQDSSRLDMEKIDFLDFNLEKIRNVLKSKFGLVLVAGPTGSGKSTTLFSMLKAFNPLEYNITTLEDPVEYNIPYINQTQVKPGVGFDFASGLRSIVRQDPDIIMVWEIRDKETAMLAIEAALTGHLVFSTIHTNSAWGTIQRLINMWVEPFLISSALKLIISQRLVKRICSKCSKTHKIPTGPISKKIQGYLNGVIDDKVEDIEFVKPGGCEICANTGYKWRMAIHEVLVMQEELDELILEKATVHDIEQKACELWMVTILQDGILKAATGNTSVDEVMKLV